MKYSVSQDGKVIGDFSTEEIVNALAEGRLTGGDHFWRKGMDGWMPLREFSKHRRVHKKPSSTDGHVEPDYAADAERAQLAALKGRADSSSREPQCPSCGSKSVQASGMAFAAGTRTSESVGVSSRGRFFYRTGRSSSLLASALAPPQKRGANAFFVLLFFGGLLGGVYWYLKYNANGWRAEEQGQKWMGLVLVMVALVLGVCGWVWSAMADGKEHAQAMDEWSKQWFCKKCGHTFTRY